MIEEIYLKEGCNGENSLVSFEGDRESINKLRYYAMSISRVDYGEKYEECEECFEEAYDIVNRPIHYCDGKIEVIDFIEDKNLDFHLGNAVKYISRAGKKHESGMSDKEKNIEDLKKAVWYINREINILQTKGHTDERYNERK